MTARGARVRQGGRDARHRRRRGPGGFSLVEAAVTLAVLGLLAALAGPSLTRMLPRTRLEKNVTILANEIALARRLALAQSVEYSVVFDTAADSYTLRRREAGGGWKILGTNRLAGSDLQSVTGFAASGTLVALPGGAMNVPPSVGGAANYGYITLGTPDGERTRRIRVETLGRVVAEP